MCHCNFILHTTTIHMDGGQWMPSVSICLRGTDPNISYALVIELRAVL